MEELNKTPNFCPSVQSASHLCISLSHFLDGQVEPQSPKKNFPGCRPAGPSCVLQGGPHPQSLSRGAWGTLCRPSTPLHREQPASSGDTSLD